MVCTRTLIFHLSVPCPTDLTLLLDLFNFNFKLGYILNGMYLILKRHFYQTNVFDFVTLTLVFGLFFENFIIGYSF
jgi:hypothetical protein